VHHPAMSWIEGRTFLMGSDARFAEEAPAHRVTISGFWIDTTAVTNADFARFVASTGYVTVAERPFDPRQFPGAAPGTLVPGGLVFRQARGPVDLRSFRNWWDYVPGACWREPEGPGSSVGGRLDHPVVQIAYRDAEAYARWAGKVLPAEAEWECAARGGLEGAYYACPDEFMPSRAVANAWQGEFPCRNPCVDDFAGTAPVKTSAPNGYGLYEMAGNVWEWTSDGYCDWLGILNAQKACCVPANPRDPSVERSCDTRMPLLRMPRKVLKGGSFLCAPNCRRYRPSARYPQTVDTASNHIGFRCIVRTAGQ
jgi:formylglycine-generating enzyme